MSARSSMKKLKTQKKKNQHGLPAKKPLLEYKIKDNIFWKFLKF